jgi:tetratricopeptide (TPR) repeat protein
MHLPHDPPPTDDAADRAHWDAVEEVSELLHEERFNEALVYLKSVLEADGKNPYAFYFLGIALFETGNLEPARDAYRACLRLAPRHLGARVALAHVLRSTGDLRGAIKEGMEALSQAPGDADALYAVGMAYHARGDTSAAIRYFHAFLEAGPEYESSEEVKALLLELGERPS